jgi:hypothetical protein
VPDFPLHDQMQVLRRNVEWLGSAPNWGSTLLGRTSIPTRSSNRCVRGPYVHESKELLLLQLEPLSQLDEPHAPLSNDPKVLIVSALAVIDEKSAAIWNGVEVEHAEKSQKSVCDTEFGSI